MGDRYFVYDPGFGGDCILSTHDALDEAIDAANESIENNWRPGNGEEWSLDVGSLSVYAAPEGTEDITENGKLVAQAAEVDVAHRPDDVDEDGYSATDSSHYWGNSAPDYYCDYRVVALSPHGEDE